MPFRRRNIAREMAAAVAVMALYILVLLMPLHQAAGLQRDLAKLGYATADSWSICAPLGPPSEDGRPPVTVKCAAAGIGKMELAAVEPVAVDLEIARAASAVRYARYSFAGSIGLAWRIGQPRAPPAT